MLVDRVGTLIWHQGLFPHWIDFDENMFEFIYKNFYLFIINKIYIFDIFVL